MERRAASATAAPSGWQSPARARPGAEGGEELPPLSSPVSRHISLCKPLPEAAGTAEPRPRRLLRPQTHTRDAFPLHTPFLRPCPARCHAFPASGSLWNGTAPNQGHSSLPPTGQAAEGTQGSPAGSQVWPRGAGHPHLHRTRRGFSNTGKHPFSSASRGPRATRAGHAGPSSRCPVPLSLQCQATRRLCTVQHPFGPRFCCGRASRMLPAFSPVQPGCYRLLPLDTAGKRGLKPGHAGAEQQEPGIPGLAPSSLPCIRLSHCGRKLGKGFSCSKVYPWPSRSTHNVCLEMSSFHGSGELGIPFSLCPELGINGRHGKSLQEQTAR